MKAKERPLRVGPFEAQREEEYDGTRLWALSYRPTNAVLCWIARRQLPALARLVGKMQAAESRRGKVRR